MNSENEIRLEFEAPSLWTDALTHYVHMRSELAEFVRNYHAVAERAIFRDDQSRDEEIFKIYRTNAVYFLEHYLTRAADLFDVYIEELIYIIAISTVDFFDEKDLKRAQTQLAALGVEASEQEIFSHAAAYLARRGKPQICEHIKTKVNIDISRLSGYWDDAITLIHVRNLVVHKSSEVDAKFAAYARGKNVPFELEVGRQIRLTERWVMETAMKVNECVYAIDECVGGALSVFRRSAIGHVWITRAHTHDPLDG